MNARSPAPRRPTSLRHTAAAFGLDAAFVIAFTAMGRATHDGDVLGPGGSGLAVTAWPFLVGLVAGWAVTRAWRRPLAPLGSGIGIWATTVAVGMLLRAVSGQGTAVAFIVVATTTLLLLLVGWRGVARGVVALRPRQQWR